MSTASREFPASLFLFAAHKLIKNAKGGVPLKERRPLPGSRDIQAALEALAARFPFLRLSSAGESLTGQPLCLVTVGEGPAEVFYNAAHHANEWLTSLLLLRFLRDYCRAAACGGTVAGLEARALFRRTTLYALPLVNPDGADLVTGALTSGPAYQRALAIAENSPQLPFPSGWKANLEGTDLNLQYPAGWEEARKIKAAAGFSSPAPRDFPGPAPLSAPESRAVAALTRARRFRLTVSLHSQGGVIYRGYLGHSPPGSRPIAELMTLLSGYPAEEAPPASGHAGYQDWFTLEFDRPGFTVEAGHGENPLPLRQFPEIYRDVRGILALGLALAPELPAP